MRPFTTINRAVGTIALLGASMVVASDFACADESTENVDHAGIISRWDGESVARGQKLFVIACAPCHGSDGVHTINPQSRPFAVDRFQNGSDPYSMFKTITGGFKNMPSQTWMTPEQRYDVIEYIRETFLKPLNPSQYKKIEQSYLDSLPKFNPTLAKPSEKEIRQPDFGPVLESQLGTSFADVLSFRLNHDVTFSYDLHRMRLAGAWRGGFLDLSRTGHFQQRGEGQPVPKGKPLPGLQTWEWAFGGSFNYPTAELLARGPLPPAWMRYRGHYVYDRKAILSFTIEGRHVLELPEVEIKEGLVIASRTLRIAGGETPLRLCVGQGEAGWKSERMVGVRQIGGGRGDEIKNKVEGTASGQVVIVAQSDLSEKEAAGGDFVAAGAVGGTEGLTWGIDEQHRIVLNVRGDKDPNVVRIICSAGKGVTELKQFGAYFTRAEKEPLVDPETLTRGGTRLWPMEIEARGKLGQEDGAYALDTVPVPFDNPYGSWLRTSALAFFPDGRAVVTTYCGDVWIVSGLNKSLEHVKWSRFASGLYEPFGAEVLGGRIYVTCRNGIVRLLDVNEDGEADFYETFYADKDVSTFFHGFNFDLQAGRSGQLFYVKPGEYTDYKLPGAIVEIAPDGRSEQIYCTGFRVPNGMGMLPDGRLTVSDNQGDWTPASKISLVRRGGFYGYVPNRKGGGAYGDRWAPDGGRIDVTKVTVPTKFDQPLVWMPQDFDNSSGGQLWVEDPRFGPLSGRLLHTSFGKGMMYYLMLQELGALAQAAIVRLPFQFEAGIMRARVNPADGQVWATGLSGWQGPANGKDGCLQRLRYTGKPMKLLEDIKVCADGLLLRFNFALDRAKALDVENYRLEQWNYLWSSKYGSDQYSVEHRGEKGRDAVKISAVKLSEDDREVRLVIPSLRPVNQMEVRVALTAGDGSAFKELAYLTINAVPAGVATK